MQRHGAPARLATLLLMVALGVTGCAGRNAVDQTSAGKDRYVAAGGSSERYPIGKRPNAPSISGALLDGGELGLRSLRGQVVVINFWASWCAPCRLEASELVETAAAVKPLGVAFVGVNIRDDRDKARAFVAASKAPWPNLFDPAGRVALAFRQVPPNTIPATIVIDRSGAIAVVYRKAVLRTDLEPILRAVAGEPA